MKKWVLVFSLIQLVFLAFMIGSLASPKWVETDFDVSIGYSTSFYDEWSIFRSSKFEGGVVICYKGYKLDGDETAIGYGDLEKDICDLKEKIDDYFIDYSDYEIDSTSDVKSICRMFQGLTAGAIIKLVFDIACMIALLVWFIGMMCMLRSVNCFITTYICSVCAFCFFYVGSILWFVATGATFGSCSKNPNNGDHPNICATHGPGLMIFIMIMFPFLIILYIVIACKAQKKRLIKGQSSSQNHPNIAPSLQMQNFQIPQPVNYGPATYGPSTYTPSTYPQGAYPAGAYPPGAYPPGVYPPGAYPPGAYPQGNQYNPSYHQANNPNLYQVYGPPPAVVANIPNGAEVKEENI
jgi:hypothetical protein